MNLFLSFFENRTRSFDWVSSFFLWLQKGNKYWQKRWPNAFGNYLYNMTNKIYDEDEKVDD